MKKKNIYMRENLNILIILGIIVGLPILIISIYLGFKTPIGFIFGITGLIFFLILLVFAINRIKWRIWARKALQNGQKFEGKVVHFGYEYRRGDSRHEPPTPDMETYWLEVKYNDENGYIKIFKTPELSFAPDERKDITCDVYVYNDKPYATNFQNLDKKKIDYQEIFCYIVIGVVPIGIGLLMNFIKNLFG